MLKINNLPKLLLSVCLILFQTSPTLSKNEGVTTTIEEAPYLVQLRSNDIIICAGTLVSEYYVISAAHCFDESNQNLTVVGGATKIFNDPGSAQSYVSAYAIPDMYTNTTYNADVAVIKLQQPLVGGLIKPITMDCDKWKTSDAVKLFGWGRRHKDVKFLSLELRTIEVRTVEQGWCKWLYWTKGKITEFMFCASPEGADVCYGDSGGPAIVNKQFCGVTSWGGGCARANSPGVYANLRKLAKFVQKAMKKLDEAETERKGLAKFVKHAVKIMLSVDA